MNTMIVQAIRRQSPPAPKRLHGRAVLVWPWLLAVLCLASGCERGALDPRAVAPEGVADDSASPTLGAPARYEAPSRAGDAPGMCEQCGAITLGLLQGPQKGPLDQEEIEAIAEQLRTVYGLNVRALQPSPLPAIARKAARSQYDGEAILDALYARVGIIRQEPEVTHLWLVNEDIFLSSRKDWRFAFSTRRNRRGGHGGYGIISVARMKGAKGRRRLMVMLGKYIGTTACGFRTTSNPRSILYNRVLSPNDLDEMSVVLCATERLR